jgi:hypothetical protein
METNIQARMEHKRLKGKKIWGRKMSPWKVVRRSDKRRFFCPSIFLPSFWLRPKAALGGSCHSWLSTFEQIEAVTDPYVVLAKE